MTSNISIAIIIFALTVLYFCNGAVEYPAHDTSCAHKQEYRYNQNPPMENELLRKVSIEIFHLDGISVTITLLLGVKEVRINSQR
jgi:hypothetical protein